MRVRNPKAVSISNKVIEYMMMAFYQHQITLSFSTINLLLDEWQQWSIEWLRTGNITYTSGNRISLIQSERLASRKYFELLAKVVSFKRYCKSRGMKVYGYEMTVNPSKLTYQTVTALNSKIIQYLRRNRHIAFIEKGIEHTYQGVAINVHLHYLIVTTSRINQRRMYRHVKAIAKKMTRGKVNQSRDKSKPYRRVDDWHKACSYVTKQCGRFPLMLVHHQWQKFMKLTWQKRIDLLARDYNTGKGLQLHYFYVNRRNQFANEWHIVKHQSKRKQSQHKPVNSHQKQQSTSVNGRMSAVNKANGKPYGAVPESTAEAISHHHTSTNEATSRFYGHGYYWWRRQPKEYKALSLFSKVSV